MSELFIGRLYWGEMSIKKKKGGERGGKGNSDGGGGDGLVVT